jgi:hypothetical protein
MVDSHIINGWHHEYLVIPLYFDGHGPGRGWDLLKFCVSCTTRQALHSRVREDLMVRYHSSNPYLTDLRGQIVGNSEACIQSLDQFYALANFKAQLSLLLKSILHYLIIMSSRLTTLLSSSTTPFFAQFISPNTGIPDQSPILSSNLQSFKFNPLISKADISFRFQIRMTRRRDSHRSILTCLSAEASKT